VIEEIQPISPDALVAQVEKMKADGYRFLTMTCTEIDAEKLELLYHFDKDLAMKHLRMDAPKGVNAPSISPVFFAAFLVENEIQDHFGLHFDELALDFGGTLLLDDDAIRTPFCKYTVTQAEAAG
jgi:ech hydrogenase subunit D